MAATKRQPKVAKRRVRDLDPDQNDRVRKVARDLQARFGGQTALAEAIGKVVEPSTLSGFLSGRQGTSRAVADRIARIAGIEYDDLVGDGPPNAPRSPKDAVRATDLYRLAKPNVRYAFDNRDPYTVDNPRLTIEFYTRRLLQFIADDRDGVLDDLPPDAVPFDPEKA